LPAAEALKAQAKQSRFLLARGFSPEIVRQVLRAAHDEPFGSDEAS
jgi:SOS response regulatory protein OraA/RecX